MVISTAFCSRVIKAACVACTAGHETTAAVLTWALFCVVQNPEVEQKLLTEVDTVVGDRAPGEHQQHCLACLHNSLVTLLLGTGLGKQHCDGVTASPPQDND